MRLFDPPFLAGYCRSYTREVLLRGDEPVTIDSNQPVEILFGVANAVFRLAPTLLVPGDPGRLFEKLTKLFGPSLNQPRNSALLDDRIAARSEPRSEKYIGNVPTPATGAVQHVNGLTVPIDLASDRDLGVAGELVPQPALSVVEDELDGRLADRLAGRRAVEDHVRHHVTAQVFRRRFTHHPAHRVDDVGFTAPVRANNTDEFARELDSGGIDKGLEAS